MKKILFFALACTTMLFAGCGDDTDPGQKQVEDPRYTLAINTVTIDSSDGTATVVTDLTPAATAQNGAGDDATTMAQLTTELITLTAPEVDDYDFLGWTIPNSTADIVSGTPWNKDPETEIFGTDVITFYITKAGVVAIANYREIPAPTFTVCPAGEVTLATPTGTITWAGSNVAGVGSDGFGVFAADKDDFGCMFQWGWKTGSDSAVIDGNPSSGNDTADNMRNAYQTGASWPESENPCPQGWRVPTSLECAYLINMSTVAAGLTDKGLADGTYSSVFWGTGRGEDLGLRVISKYNSATISSADRTLIFPNAGYRNAGGTSQMPGENATYWTSDPNGNNGWTLIGSIMRTTGGFSNTNLKTFGAPVRCVR